MPLPLDIDYDRGLPVYRQIYEAVTTALASGALGRDEQLPTIHELAHRLEINPNTVARAYRELEQDGHIVGHRGRGTFPAAELVDGNNKDKILRAIYDKTIVEAAQHGIAATEVVRFFPEGEDMTVFHAIVELSKASWRVLRRHPRLIWFPAISLTTLIALVLMITPIVAPDDQPPWLMLIVITAIAYLNHVFFQVALTGEALKALRGETPSIVAGLATAVARLPAIASFSAITGTFGLLLGMVGRSTSVAVKVARAIVSTAWSLATYLAIPVMVQERRGGLTSLRRSSDLFRRTWGETTLSEVGLRVLTAHLGLILVLIGFALLDLFGDSLGVVLVVLALVIGAVAVIGTLEAVYRAALYVFAAEGVIPEPFDSPELEDIWRTKSE